MSIGTLVRIARVLDVDVAKLLRSSRPAAPVGGHQVRIRAIRDALTSVDDLLGELDGAACREVMFGPSDLVVQSTDVAVVGVDCTP